MNSERILAEALHRVTVESPGLLSDADMLNDPFLNDSRPVAAAVLSNLDAAGYVIVPKDSLAALITEATTALLNDRAEVGYHDDIRPYIRLRNYTLRYARALSDGGES